eukprot:3036212-Rhodomonas_salina.1
MKSRESTSRQVMPPRNVKVPTRCALLTEMELPVHSQKIRRRHILGDSRLRVSKGVEWRDAVSARRHRISRNLPTCRCATLSSLSYSI